MTLSLYRRPLLRSTRSLGTLRRSGEQIMSLRNVWTRMLGGSLSSRRLATHRQPVRRRPAFWPRLEILEARTVLSTWTITSPADSGAGSLRAAIAAAQSGDQ